MKSNLLIIYLLSVVFCFFTAELTAQTNVTRIYTDHSGYFTSATSSPQNIDAATQHLLAFQTGTSVWSTGVNDAVLTSNGVVFTPLVFNAMPATVNGSNGSAVIGIGRQYGGFVGSNGCDPVVTLPQGLNVSAYLTDGINGLDLSTAIFNIGGNIEYSVSSIEPTAIGDGVPDIIVTQTGDLSALRDSFKFMDISNNIVGNQIGVDFSGVSTVARPLWKFYTLAGACGASTQGTRALRVIAFDLADLGITASNYTDIAKFNHKLTPNTDVAFVAYNTISATILPITLLSFNAEKNGRQVQLNWQTATEINNDYFTVERSADGKEWQHVLTRKGAGNSTAMLSYDDVDKFPLSGVSYYRLKQTDYDGQYVYSNTIAVNLNHERVDIFPNPVTDVLSIRGKDIHSVEVINVLGQNVTNQVSFVNNSSSFVQINLEQLGKGYYFIQCNGETYPIVVE